MENQVLQLFSGVKEAFRIRTRRGGWRWDAGARGL